MFTDEVVERMAAFTCAADEVWRLQRGSEADCVLFQRWSNDGERITDRGSRQGFWVFSPGGARLGRVNSRSPEKVIAMLDRALEQWDELDEEARVLDDDDLHAPAHRWEDGYPEGGLALERFSRDVSDERLRAERSARWNRDTVWFSAGEVRAMLPESATLGDEFALPSFASRLARYALVDDPRGQTLPYAPAEVTRADLTATVTAIDGARVQVSLAGTTSASASDEWLLGDNDWKPKRRFPHGIACTLVGTATFDLESHRFVELDVVALGERFGRTIFNGRRNRLEPSLVGYSFTTTGDRLAPTFASLYDVPWMPRPETPNWRDRPPAELDGGR